jgi:hypothetical protein
MAMNDTMGLICCSDWGTAWFGPFSISWQNSMGSYAFAPHREWGNVLVVFKGREFIFH